MPLSRYLDKFIILGNSALNKQLGADTNGNIYTHENKLWWETWAIEVAGDDGRVFLRSDHGKLLTSTAQGLWRAPPIAARRSSGASSRRRAAACSSVRCSTASCSACCPTARRPRPRTRAPRRSGASRRWRRC
ncbi:hypothetical protein [Nannocystis pusilla]|uniref:hypothetical protein n=1 Tax=Nannocystis pusilla TaxID=889268 RepID=UPI003B7B2AB3